MAGPAAWEGVCRTGQYQSPIDLPTRPLESLRLRSTNGVKLNYGEEEATTIVNTGHGTMQVMLRLRARLATAPR